MLVQHTERERGKSVLIPHHLRPAIPAFGNKLGRALEAGVNFLCISDLLYLMINSFSGALTSTECISGSANNGIARDETTTDIGTSRRCFSQAARRHRRIKAEDFVDNAI